jgi:hypothetical protein
MLISYQLFLRILSQFVVRSKIKVDVEGREIFIHKDKKRWILSSLIFKEKGDLSKSVHENFSSLGFLRWQERGAFLKLNREESSLFLVQEITSTLSYLRFKALFTDFIQNAIEWEEIMRKLVEHPPLGQDDKLVCDCHPSQIAD